MLTNASQARPSALTQSAIPSLATGGVSTIGRMATHPKCILWSRPSARMNAIVVIALKRPYTFVVLAILILIFGGRAALRTPTDIFPNIGIPVVAVIWSYNGLTPEDMSGRVVYYYERALTTTVGNIENIESESIYGRGIGKIFFHPGTDVAAGHGRVRSLC